MKYAIKYIDPSPSDPVITSNEYITDAFGEVLIFKNADDARDYAEKHIEDGMVLQIVQV